MNHANYFPGDSYENDIASASTELIAYIVAGFIYTKFGARKFFVAAYLLAAVAGIGILAVDINLMSGLEMFFSYIGRFGISATYQANDLFPIIFSSTTFGVCNIFGGIAGAVSIQVTLLDENPMMGIYLAIVVFGCLSSVFLQQTNFPTSFPNQITKNNNDDKQAIVESGNSQKLVTNDEKQKRQSSKVVKQVYYQQAYSNDFFNLIIINLTIKKGQIIDIQLSFILSQTIAFFKLKNYQNNNEQDFDTDESQVNESFIINKSPSQQEIKDMKRGNLSNCLKTNLLKKSSRRSSTSSMSSENHYDEEEEYIKDKSGRIKK